MILLRRKRAVQCSRAKGSMLSSPQNSPQIEFNADLVKLISKTDAALSELSGLGRTLPNPHLLIAPYVRREAVLSSRIEGTRASLSDGGSHRTVIPCVMRSLASPRRWWRAILKRSLRCECFAQASCRNPIIGLRASIHADLRPVLSCITRKFMTQHYFLMRAANSLGERIGIWDSPASASKSSSPVTIASTFAA